MATTVEITLGDDGKLTVGIADQPSADVDDAQQVANVAQALAMAKHLLENPPQDGDSDDASGAGGDSAAGGAGDAAAAPDAAAGGAPTTDNGAQADTSGAGGAGGAAGQPSAADIWQQLASQQGPAH